MKVVDFGLVRNVRDVEYYWKIIDVSVYSYFYKLWFCEFVNELCNNFGIWICFLFVGLVINKMVCYWGIVWLSLYNIKWCLGVWYIVLGDFYFW